MHVLLVTALVGGGVGRHVRQLAQGLRDRGHQVSVACPDEVARRFDLAEVGARVLPVELGHRVRPGADHGARRRLREAMAGVDVVHAHGMRAGAAAALARPRHGPRLVVTSHNGPPAGGAGVVYELLERVVCRRADLVLGVSGDLVERARRRGARETGEAVVPSEASAPMSQTERAAARDLLRSELGLGSEQAVVLTVGRLAGQKRVEAALAAYQLAVGSWPAAVMVVAGEGPEEPVLRRFADQGPGQVRWLGHREDVPMLLAGADLVISSARWEGQPLVLQEALSAGASIIATDVGGTSVVLGGAGRLVPGEDDVVVHSLAEAICELLADPQARRGLGEQALLRAAQLPDADAAVDAALASYVAAPHV